MLKLLMLIFSDELLRSSTSSYVLYSNYAVK